MRNVKTNHFLSILFNFFEQNEGIILLLCFHLLLRIPNLFEPYWYGDEAIYLTIGHALRDGLRLYADIIDHKTPLIYLFAMLPSQLLLRAFLLVWMSITVFVFYLITKQLRFTKARQLICTALFIILTSVPWLEGNVPNGELFVMGFSLMGSWIFFQTSLFNSFLYHQEIKIRTVLNKKEVLKFLTAGLFFSFAILTKVPAVFEILPFFVIGWFIFLDRFSIKRSRKIFFAITGYWEMLCIGIVFPILLSIVFFYLIGAGRAYIEYGLLYNFRYAGSWQLPISTPLTILLFSLPAKVGVLITVVLTLFAFRQKTSPLAKFLIVWSMSSLVGVTLSSRPYPHYLLQAVPAFCLLATYLVVRTKRYLEKSLILFPFLCLVIALYVIQFGFYNNNKYYNNFFQYISRQIRYEQYANTFNPHIADNTIASAILRSSTQPRTFIWGTNPLLYAQSGKYPTGRFTVSFHIQDFPGAFEETYQDLTAYEPEFIVVMKNERTPFSIFFTYLHMYYYPYKELEHMIIYKRTDLPLSEL